MITPVELIKKVKRVWSQIEAAPAEDMVQMDWGWGKAAAEAFTGVKPVDVDIDSSGFGAATPLFDIPGRAAAAYLGTYIISLLDGLHIQLEAGFATDIITRAHTITVLTDPKFWTDIAEPNLPADCLEVIAEVADLMISNHAPLALTDSDVTQLQSLIRLVKN